MPAGPPPQKLINPAPWAYRITSTLGDPRPYGEHEGIDLAPTSKTPAVVIAAGAGKVLDAGYQPDGYGYFVKIDHGDGLQTIYGHLDATPLVAKGETVQQAQALGYAGNTGYSTGKHLHFSVVRNGSYEDPIAWITDAAYEVIAHVDEQVSKAIDKVKVDCYGGWIKGLLDDDEFNECVELNLTETERQALERDEAIGAYLQEGNFGAGLANAIRDIDAGTIKGVPGYVAGAVSSGATAGLSSAIVRDIVTPLKRSVIDGVTLPIRAFVNAFQLSETPLTDGASTVAWLQKPENQRVYIAANVALVIVIILILIAAAQFLREPAKTVVQTATNPVGAVVDSVTE